MSGIVGVWNVDGAPVSREVLAPMSARLAHRGPEGESFWTSSELGMAVQMTQSTPESLAEVQPLLHASGVVLAFDGRLDNRAELLQELAPREGLSTGAPDPVFVLAAYLQRGADFLERLAGEFALALWDPRVRILYLGRDPMGGRPIYYGWFGDCFLFASEIKALLAHPLVKTRPNDLALAEYLYRAYDYGDESKTFFENIHTVPPGNRLRVTGQGMNLRRFWDFDTSRQIRFKTDQEYVEAYREHFFTAVRRRLRSAFPISIMASGGLDSSSIFCTAMTLKRESPSDFPELFGVTGVSEYPDTDEQSYQLDLEKQYGVQLLKVPIRQTASLEAAAKYVHAAEGPFSQWQDWKRLWEESHIHGARTVLSGFFGDQVLSFPGYMVDLIKHLRLATLSKHWKTYCEFHAWKNPSELRQELFQSLKYYAVPAPLMPAYRALRRHRTYRQPGLVLYSEDFAALAAEQRARSHPPSTGAGSAHARGLYHLARSTVHVQRLTMDSLWEAQCQLHTSYPFRDRDLIAFLMALPGEKVFLDGIPRGLHRAAMAGVLPESVRTRKDKADFTAIGQAGVLQDLSKAEAALPHSRAARRGYLKPPHDLTRELAKIRSLLAAGSPAITGWDMHDVIWLDTWLSVFFPDS